MAGSGFSDQVTPLFPTFLFSRQFDGVDELNRALTRFIRAQSRDLPAHASAEGGRRTTGNLFGPDAPPEMQALAAMISDAFGAALPAMIPNIESVPRELLDFSLRGWSYILHGGDFLAPHVHAEATVVGTYYVRCPATTQRPGRDRVPGHIVLMDPGPAGAMRNHGGLSYPTLHPVQPREGLLVLFPGHVLHYVSPFRGDGERIAISFDFVHRPPQR